MTLLRRSCSGFQDLWILLLYQRVEILIGLKVMMVSAARDHYMFKKYINLVGTTIFDSKTN